MRRLGKAKAFRYPDVNSKILAAMLFCRPVVVESAHMMSQLIADSQSLSGRHVLFLLRPATPLERGDRAPIAASKGDDVLFAHGNENSREKGV